MLSLEIQRRLLISTSLILLAMTSGFAAIKYVYVGNAQFPYVALIMSGMLAGNICYLRLGGTLASSQLAMMLLMVVGFVWAAIYSGGYSSAPVILAPLLPMIAIFWFNRLAGWLMAILLLFILGALLIAESFNFLPENSQSLNNLRIARFVAISTVTLVCTSLAWLFAQAKEQAIDLNRQVASTDHLTNLPNRRAIDEALLREVGRAKRNNAWFSFALLDVDLFKRYNDSRGHQVGDECLVEIANLITNSLKRPADVAGRFGGEEFVMILPDTGPEGAYYLAESVRKSLKSLNLTHTEKSDERVSVTIGVVSILGDQIAAINDIVREADAALYRGKSNGRNQVVMKIIDGSSLGLAAQA